MMLFELTEKQRTEGETTISPSNEHNNQGAPEAVNVSHGTVIDRIRSVATPILRSLGCDLFDLEFSGTVLRIFIDKMDGVTLDECAKASRHLGTALDVEEAIPGSYTLEVSSPGLDRPLRNQDDYRRFIEKKVKIRTAIKFQDQKVFVGRLLKVESEIVSISLGGGGKIDIPFDQIEGARLEVELPSGRNKGGN